MFFSRSLIFCVIIAVIPRRKSSGAIFTPKEEKVSVKRGQLAALQWTCHFPLSSGQVSVQVFFKAPDQDQQGFPLVIINNGNAQKNNANVQFKNKVQVTTQSRANSFILFLDISNIEITEEGEYTIYRYSLDGTLSLVKNLITLEVIVPPNIKKIPREIEKLERQDAALPCIATAGNPKPLTFQWFFKANDRSKGKAVTEQVKEFDRYYYNISIIDYRSVGVYECVVTNGHGDRDSFEINLRVKHAPYIEIAPQNTTVFEGNGIESMDCGAKGNPPTKTYHWYQGLNLVELKQSTDSIKIENPGTRLRFVNPSRSLATKYSCAGENEYGTGTPVGAYLNVTYIPERIEIRNENPLKDGTAVDNVVNGNEGSNITVTCYSKANPAATYSWSMLVQSGGTKREVKIEEDNQTGQLILYSAQVNDTGEYKCEAFNYPNPSLPKKRYFQQKTITIKVNYGPLRTNITVNGYNQSHIVIQVKENSPVEIKCESDSEPSASYNIKYGNVQKNTDVKVGYYRIASLTIPDEGDYTCIASNPVLKTKEMRTIKVLVGITPSIVRDPPKAQQIINEEETATINCYAKGRPAPKVYWTKNGKNVTNFNDGVITSSYIILPGKASDREMNIRASLTFTGIRSSDEGNYKCTVYNGAGSVDVASNFIVNYAPKFLQPLDNVTVEENGEVYKVSFRCSVRAKPDNNIQYRWYFNDKLTSRTKSVYTIERPKRSDSGNYQCEAENGLDKIRRSTIGTLVVKYRPEITSINQRVEVNVEGTFTLKCVADGVPPPIYEWKKEGDVRFKHSGDVLTITNVNPSQKGIYFCNVRNVVGNNSESVKVFVVHKPIIVSNSPAETKIGAAVGDKAYLNCDAEGYPIPVIRWKEEGSSSFLSNRVDDFFIKPSETDFGARSELSFIVRTRHLGTKFVCDANNKFGPDQMMFQVLRKGKPDPPVSITVTDKLLPVFPITVNVILKWIPGFNGGYPVKFILNYKETNQFVDHNFLELKIGAAPQNTFIFRNRKPGTTYQFALVAQNNLGISSMSQVVEYKTTVPPDPVATFEVIKRDDTSVIVRWVIKKAPVPKSSRKRRGILPTWDYGLIRYRVIETESWHEEKILSIPPNGTYVVKDLKPSETYEFYFVLYDTSGEFATPVSGGSPITPGGKMRVSGSTSLSKTDIIAIAVGCGGTILIIVIIILFIAIHRRAKNNSKSPVYNPRVRVDIPVSTMKSGYSDVVRASYMNGEDEDPFAMDSTIIEDNHDKSPPPEYNSVHYYADLPVGRDDNDPPISFRQAEDPTPSYTSFGRLQKKSGKDRPDNKNQSKSMISLNGTRSAEISRGNEQNRYSMDNLNDYHPKDSSVPLIQKSKNDRNNKNKRNSRGRLSSDEDLPEPPNFMKDAIRSPPSDEGHLNRAPGAFGDRNGQRFKKPQTKTYDEPPYPPPNGIHQSARGDSPTPSSIASSKPYRSDNEYIDDQDDKYVGYLV